MIGDNRPRLYWAQMAAHAPGRRLGARLPGLDREGAGLRLEPRRGHGGRGGGPGAGGQDPRPPGPAARSSGSWSTTTRAACPPTGRLAEVVRGGAGAGPRASRPRARAFEAEVEKGRPDDVALICYTSGTTGNPKGAMLTHANAIAVAAQLRGRSRRRTPDDDSLPICPWPGWATRSTRWSLSLVVGFCVNCPGEPRDGAARPARARAHRAPGAAAHLGEHAHRGAGARGRRHSPQAPGLRLLPAAWRSGRRSSGPTASRCRSGLRLQPRSASSSSTGRCATSWACGARGGASPAARRSGPTPSASSASIGVNLKQVYGSTETTGLVSLQPDRRGQSDHRGPAVPGDRGADRRPRRGAREEARGSSRATSRTTRRPARSSTPRAGSTPATPASSTRAGHLVIIDRAKDVGRPARRHALRARSSSRTS